MDRISVESARQNLGELCQRALDQPVVISRPGGDEVVMLSLAEYRRLRQKALPDELVFIAD